MHRFHISKYNSKISQVDCCIHASQQNSESTVSDIKTILEKEGEKKKKDCLPFALY